MVCCQERLAAQVASLLGGSCCPVLLSATCLGVGLSRVLGPRRESPEYWRGPRLCHLSCIHAIVKGLQAISQA